MDYTGLMNYLWRTGQMTWREFYAATGERVRVVSEGEPDETTPGVWIAAEVTVDGERRRGCVAVGKETPVPDGAVLCVTEAHSTPVLGVTDRQVIQIEVAPPPAAVCCYDGLRAGVGGDGCTRRVAEMDSLHRTSLYTSLMVERLQRKTQRIAQIFAASDQDWNQTFHVLLLTAMGGDRNREAFASLASKATATMVSREKGSVARLEALLLGTAGFLFGGSNRRLDRRDGDDYDYDFKDDYTLMLSDEARHLFTKYSIVPLKSGEWNLAGLYPANHPAVRLAETASLMSKKDFMLDGVLKCRTSGDVEELFDATASEYWRTHYKPSGGESTPSDKRIGRAKARLIGINLAAPLMFAYGRNTGIEELCDRALDLLTTIPPEKNRLLERWYAGGCTAESGFESQALLELETQYCAHGCCADCPVGQTALNHHALLVHGGLV
ncbi:MAG: DUF2851 family protein [Alistipes sp.]|jgi:hypothetical protein|nr:DUF2851 family protein [Alistipes sp.]